MTQNTEDNSGTCRKQKGMEGIQAVKEVNSGKYSMLLFKCQSTKENRV